MKDENNHHQFIVDETVKPIVKKVFARYLSGESMFTIAKELIEREVLTPSKHIGRQEERGFGQGRLFAIS